MSVEVTKICDSGNSFKITGNNVLGGSITVEAIPKDGYEFKSWDDGITDNPRVFNNISKCGIHYVGIFEPKSDDPIQPEPEPEPINECDGITYENIYNNLNQILGGVTETYGSDTIDCGYITTSLNNLINSI